MVAPSQISERKIIYEKGCQTSHFFYLIPTVVFYVMETLADEKYSFEIDETIKPKILSTSAGCASMQYNIGDILVIDELCNTSTPELLYIVENQDDIEFDLKIEGWSGSKISFGHSRFIYYLKGNEIETNRDVVPQEILVKNKKSINGFKWTKNKETPTSKRGKL